MAPPIRPAPCPSPRRPTKLQPRRGERRRLTRYRGRAVQPTKGRSPRNWPVPPYGPPWGPPPHSPWPQHTPGTLAAPADPLRNS